MNKIPTLFLRGPDFGVIPVLTPGTEWVIAGEGIPTEKLDGCGIRVTVAGGTLFAVEKRRNPTREQKEAGEEPGYVEAAPDDPANKWLLEAARNIHGIHSWLDGLYSCEAIGPKIQGNPLRLTEHRAYRLDWHMLPLVDVSVVTGDVGATFEALKNQMLTLESQFMPHSGILAEGVVWHHLDGRRTKLKRKDFR